MNDERYTPEYILNAVKDLYAPRGIQVDPFSCKEANICVNAWRYYTKEDNGLMQEWFGDMWINPPFSGGTIKKALKKLRNSPCVTNVCVLLPLNHSSTLLEAIDYFDLFCVLTERPKFDTPNGNKDNPTHGAIIFYRGIDHTNFIHNFRGLGVICKCVRLTNF